MDWDYIIKNWSVWAVITLILIVNTLPKIATFLSDRFLPERLRRESVLLDSELKLKEEEIEWQRNRILRAEQREDNQIETMRNMEKTLILINASLEQSNKDHTGIATLLAQMARQSEDEHRSMLAAVNVSQHLYDRMIVKMEARRASDFTEAGTETITVDQQAQA
jgi:hypothetical protein